LWNLAARHAFTATVRRMEIAVDDTTTMTTTPEERRLIRRLYGPDPREDGRQPEDQRSEDSSFVFDIEDMALVGRPDDGRHWPHQ
jgi:hypothetical protein